METSFEKILTNCDVLRSIFLYLDFKEHLKLIKICPQFEYAILHGVWRLMYKKLHILEMWPGNLTLRYNAINNVKTVYSLTTDVIHIILHHSSMYINKLELNHIGCLENIISFKYNHLTELSLRETIAEDTHLQQLAENCLNLQSFALINFSNSKKESNIRTDVFGEMKALNKLEIKDTFFPGWNYFDVQQLFSLVHLKTLIIDILILDSNDNNGYNNNSTARVYNIENLRIRRLDLQAGKICFIEDLIRMENLTKLTIGLKIVSIDDNFLTQISNACPKLYELSFIGCHLTFKAFPCMNNLEHLTFESCARMGLENFDDIFRKLKLKSLSLVGVLMRYKANAIFNYNYTSNTLETLNIHGPVDTNLVTTFFNQQHKFKNVSKVRLLRSPDRCSQSTGLCFSHNFPYLQELIMNSYYISSEDILCLEHLKVLQFNLFDNMSSLYLDILFQHPKLTHISITPCRCRDCKSYCERLPKCCEGLTTTLEYLSLPSVVYEMGLSFWTSFRQRNKLLKLEIR